MDRYDQKREIAVRFHNVKKMYKLGQIGGGTLQRDLQSWWARVRGREDPNSKIGQSERLAGTTFMALNGIDLTIYKGEALGIIGANGAGKSTMLKLLSRVTAPTEGEIDIYGRIVSMLEVGTGFNGEMTGRENIYMNGAILGMTRAEIDAKMEDIIAFSEVREFIDTPVKRYSSGMYVKLAFSVAAHLDSEIMIMDEVLAVGDAAFQKKCLDKMREAAEQQNRTVLYVSHNMNTIRQLCDRCIVLEQGKIVFDGQTEDGINAYMNNAFIHRSHHDFLTKPQNLVDSGKVRLLSLDVREPEELMAGGDVLAFTLRYISEIDIKRLIVRLSIYQADRAVVATAFSEPMECQANVSCEKQFELDVSSVAPGDYGAKIMVYEIDDHGNQIRHDSVHDAVAFTVAPTCPRYPYIWNGARWGSHVLPVMREVGQEASAAGCESFHGTNHS